MEQEKQAQKPRNDSIDILSKLIAKNIIKHETKNDTNVIPSSLTKEEFEDYDRALHIRDKDQDRILKRSVKNWTFRILAAELGAMFVLIFLNGSGWRGFHVNDVIFGIFINGILIQTYGVVRIISEHLFPKKPDLH